MIRTLIIGISIGATFGVWFARAAMQPPVESVVTCQKVATNYYPPGE